MLTSLALLIVVEGWGSPVATARFDPLGPPDDAAYEYLPRAAGGRRHRTAHVDGRTEADGIYQYMTLVQRHRIVNGRSGYLSPLYVWLAGGNSPLKDVSQVPEALAMLRAIGVRYVVLHGTHESDDVTTAWRATLEDPAQAVAVRTFAGTTVATIAPADIQSAPPGLRRVPAAAIHATASHSPDRLPLLFDGDLDTRWLTGHAQDGREWIELTFANPKTFGSSG